MFLQGDAHELATCTHTGLLKELLQYCLDRTLGDSQPRANLFVGQPFKYPLEHSLFALRQPLSPGRGGVAGGRGNDGSGYRRVEPDLSGNNLSDGLNQAAGRTVLEKDAGRTVFQGAQHNRVAHAGGYQEDLAEEAAAACLIDKLRSLLMAKIVIQQNDVDFRQMRQGERLGR